MLATSLFSAWPVRHQHPARPYWAFYQDLLIQQCCTHRQHLPRGVLLHSHDSQEEETRQKIHQPPKKELEHPQIPPENPRSNAQKHRPPQGLAQQGMEIFQIRRLTGLSGAV